MDIKLRIRYYKLPFILASMEGKKKKKTEYCLFPKSHELFYVIKPPYGFKFHRNTQTVLAKIIEQFKNSLCIYFSAILNAQFLIYYILFKIFISEIIRE